MPDNGSERTRPGGASGENDTRSAENQAIMIPGVAEVIDLANNPAVVAFANSLSIGSAVAGVAIAAVRAFSRRAQQTRGEVVQTPDSVIFRYGPKEVRLTPDEAKRFFEFYKTFEDPKN